MSESIKFDYSNVMAEAVGKNNGITKNELTRYKRTLTNYKNELKKEWKSGELKFLSLPMQQKITNEVLEYAKKQKKKINTFVVLGIGGSALGNTALVTALCHPFHNLVSDKSKAPKIFILDNIDPDQFYAFLETIDFKKALFNVISKSGETAETMSQFLIIYNMLKKKFGKKINEHLIITTDAEKGFLRKIIEQEKYDNFIVPDGVGGRFSVLTPVGLLSSSMVGIDIKNLLKGANSVVEMFFKNEFEKNPIMLNCAIHYHLDKRGKKMSVMMPYSSRLKDFADWYRQLWAESLGKRFTLKGKEIFAGQTPIKALGVTDQHSQVQLYTEGPNDKVFTILCVEEWNKKVTIPKLFNEVEGLNYLGNHTLNELMTYERMGTEIALKAAKRPTCKLIFPKVNAFTVGQFIMFYEIQTALAGKLLQINPYDQPGVEAGKKATYALMGRKGYESFKKEISLSLKKAKRYSADVK
jgi:glucose-6-phosphate isomerase